MSVNSVYLLFGVLVSLVLTYFFVKRLGKSGCMTFGYIGLVILSVNSLAIGSLFFMYSAGSDVYAVLTSGENYTSTVVSFTSEVHHDSDDGSSYMMYTPTVRFVTHDNELIQRELDFSASEMQIGDVYRVNYDKASDKVITLGFNLVIKFIGAFIFCIMFSFLCVGIVMYAFNFDMTGYKDTIAKVGLYFFIPFLMIGFNVLLIYGIFFGNTVPSWVTLLLVFFSVMLGLGTLGYFKMMFSNEEPKMKTIVSTKWHSDWKTKK
ncbi:hypothetical protein [Winogradskyella sp. PC D3.3]